MSATDNRLVRRFGSTAILAGVAGGFGSLDTALNIAFPDLLDDLDLEVGDLQWIVVSYVLAYGGLLLAAGQLGDRLGHGRVLRIGAVVSAVGLIGCGAAPSFEVLLAARVMQGVGVAMVMASAPALLTTAGSGDHHRAVGVFQTAAAAGLAVGPIVGGLLVEWQGWRAVFWFRVPLGLALVVLTIGRRRLPVLATAKVDRLGTLLISLGLGAIVLALNLAGTQGWRSPVVLATAAIGVAAGFWFVGINRRATDPIIDLGLFRSAQFATANALAVVANGAIFATWLLVPSLLVDELGVSLLVAGIVLAVSPVSTAIASAWVSGRSNKSKPWRLVWLGLAIEGFGMLAFGAIDFDWSDRAITTLYLTALMAVVGGGLGLFSVPNMAMVMRTVGDDKQGVAGALSLMTRTVGIVAGVALASAYFDWLEPSRGFTGAFSAVFVASGIVLLATTVLTVRRNFDRGDRPPDPLTLRH